MYSASAKDAGCWPDDHSQPSIVQAAGTATAARNPAPIAQIAPLPSGSRGHRLLGDLLDAMLIVRREISEGMSDKQQEKIRNGMQSNPNAPSLRHAVADSAKAKGHSLQAFFGSTTGGIYPRSRLPVIGPGLAPPFNSNHLSNFRPFRPPTFNLPAKGKRGLPALLPRAETGRSGSGLGGGCLPPCRVG